MTVDVIQQGRALCQALLLGVAFGVTYDLFRILRVRIKLPLLGAVLDLIFWLAATGTLFLWSQQAWGGQIRLYGAAFCLLGGGVYFWLFSRFFLWLGYRLADLATLFLGILMI
ncbi:MAG: spore cortex biosynthesis protein YabQ, partial [Lawsonibacter sp.]